ncbi:MAG: sugar kinase [Polaromonas sp.]|uniref:sugar kinase n=1 Tax=Polaromonas sp. TaxID=1869339 RepID=UPI00182DECB4|nr:sugar kinase [Polaromonas sp.]MBA3594987.1 sugar kinase [Polaromonas sp.]
MTEKFDVVTFGEALMLLLADRPGPLETVDSFSRRIAGAECNVAIGLSRLGFRVGWASRVGVESMGRYVLGAMRSEGVDCAHVLFDGDQKTGFMFKGKVNDGSDPPVEYHRKGSAASLMDLPDIDETWLLSARHLHATGVFAAVSASTFAVSRKAMDLMKAAGRTVSFDPNLRPNLWVTPQAMREAVNELSTRADWVLPGLEEGRFLTGEQTPEAVALFFRQRGAALVVVKLGSAGAYFDGASGTGYVPGFPVPKVVDTVGAGDGFAVGVISGLLDGLDLPEAVKRGAWIGARAVQVRGDSEGFPTRAELTQHNVQQSRD